MPSPGLNFGMSTRIGCVLVGLIEIALCTLYIKVLFCASPNQVFHYESHDLTLVMVTAHSAYILACLMLICGAIKENRYFMLPWLYAIFANMSALIMSNILKRMHVYRIAGVNIATIDLFLELYFFLIVFSHFTALVTRETRRRHQRALLLAAHNRITAFNRKNVINRNNPNAAANPLLNKNNNQIFPNIDLYGIQIDVPYQKKPNQTGEKTLPNPHPTKF